MTSEDISWSYFNIDILTLQVEAQMQMLTLSSILKNRIVTENRRLPSRYGSKLARQITASLLHVGISQASALKVPPQVRSNENITFKNYEYYFSSILHSKFKIRLTTPYPL
ncbi:hypothetical protein J6590_093848 [Homalodisca vitripennis]|nr:hypothetical protein J6590_093848 [Homalodisca vitripennis]